VIGEEDILLSQLLAGFWTEHSARPVIPTAAQSLGAPKESRDCLGRWCPTGADDYARAYRAAAGELQLMVLKAVLGRDKRLDESEVMDRIAQLPEYGVVTQAQAEGMKADLEKAVKSFDQQLAAAAGSTEVEDIPGAGLPAGLAQARLGKVGVAKQSRRAKRMKYLIVYTRNRRSAKLHKVGGCEWTRSTLNDTQEFEAVTIQMYNSRCKLCWARKLEETEQSLGDDSSSDQSTL
jgi:hypothetical protein